MKILEIHPSRIPDLGFVRVVATFDVELNESVRLYALKLMEAPDGRRFVYAPQAGSRRTATFARPLAEEITSAANEQLKAVTANGTHSQN